MTIYPLYFNKTIYDHLIYKPQDIHKVFKNVKLKRFKTEIWVTFLSLCHKVMGLFIQKIKGLTIRLPTYAMLFS